MLTKATRKNNKVMLLPCAILKTLKNCYLQFITLNEKLFMKVKLQKQQQMEKFNILNCRF
jgi:hypothetical protein